MTTVVRRSRRRVLGSRAGTVAVTVTVAVVWLVTWPRTVPTLFGDHGSYISMAERVLAGDRLYVDVWDNKGPLYYDEIAVGRLVSRFADIALEVGWVALACAAVLSLCRFAGIPRRGSLLTALAGVPVVVTGAAYTAGMTHLPGVALCLGVAGLAVRRRWVVAGALTGVLLFSKEIMVPIAGAAILTAAWHHRSWRGLVRAVVSALVVAAAVVGMLWARGELGGFVSTITSNLAYADGGLSQSRYGSVVGHLLNAMPEDGRGGGLVSLVAVVVVLVTTGRPASRTSRPGEATRSAAERRSSATTLVWDLTAACLVAAVAVIAATAPWPHHSQSFYVAGCLALVLVAVRLSGPARDVDAAAGDGPTGDGRVGDPERAGAPGRPVAWSPARVSVLTVLAAFVLGGALHPYYYLESAREVPARVEALAHDSVDSAVIVQQPRVHTYARAGSNDDGAHAVGLRAYALACPRFHHYSFEGSPVFDSVLACLPTADALIVDETIRDEPDRPEWNAYVAKVRALVSTGYTCVPTSRSQVCIKDSLYTPPPSSTSS